MTNKAEKTSNPADLKKNGKIKKKRNYYFPPDVMLSAIEAIKNGASYRKVSKEYQIPVTTLFKRSKCPVDTIKSKMGPPTVLTYEEELKLVQWIEQRAIDGCPATKKEFLDNTEVFVKNLDRKNPFRDGRPGKNWFEGFIRRHPNVNFESMEKTNDETSNQSSEVDNFHANLIEFVEMSSENSNQLEPDEISQVETDPVEYIETKPEVFIEAKPLRFAKATEVSTEFLQVFEHNLPEGMLKHFQNHDKCKPWTGPVEMKGLYLYWLKIKNILEKVNIDKELQQLFYESSNQS